MNNIPFYKDLNYYTKVVFSMIEREYNPDFLMMENYSYKTL
ncbi:hypothetical protein HMPREF2534_01944 [Bacteroides thetaiotaomicron]|nr:hypothetical protein HMPREF2534_01944 [Bacteroides thetaiotaomicron]